MTKPARLSALACLLALGAVFAAPATAADGENRLFELRTYTAADGKLDDLHARFRNHTNKLFEKHGMTLVGYWTPADEPGSENTLVYILAYKDLDARKAAWKGFMGDPEWQKVFAESRADGPLVTKVDSVFLDPTDYSPIK